MSSTPTRRGTEPELDDETKAILDQRLQTLDEDAKKAVDARQAIEEGRTKLKHPRSN